MSAQKTTFEGQLKRLKVIVNHLESGDVPLDEALQQFKSGVELSDQLQKKLTTAKRTLTKVVDQSGSEVPYDRDRNGHDVNNQVSDDGKH